MRADLAPAIAMCAVVKEKKMKKGAKELIAKAVPRKHDKFFELYVIDSERAYNGFWGKNGYNEIILIGRASGCEEYELITDHSDVIHVFRGGFDIDVDSKQGVVRIWSTNGFELSNLPLSSVTFNSDTNDTPNPTSMIFKMFQKREANEEDTDAV